MSASSHLCFGGGSVIILSILLDVQRRRSTWSVCKCFSAHGSVSIYISLFCLVTSLKTNPQLLDVRCSSTMSWMTELRVACSAFDLQQKQAKTNWARLDGCTDVRTRTRLEQRAEIAPAQNSELQPASVENVGSNPSCGRWGSRRNLLSARCRRRLGPPILAYKN